MSYRTPGVFVEEISKLPASVAQTETAIPAFIGYTEKAENANGETLLNIPTRIESTMEYEQLYGGPPNQAFKITLADEEPHLPKSADFKDEASPFLMHHALNMFFANGGGPCFIVSAGEYLDGDDPNVPEYEDLKSGLDSIQKNDEITLIVIPEAVNIEDEDHYQLVQDVLAHNNDQVNRFGIFDVRSEDHDGDDFRTGSGSEALDKGAAYYPHLKSTIRYPYQKSGVELSGEPFDGVTWAALESVSAVLNLQKMFKSLKEKVEEADSELDTSKPAQEVLKVFKTGLRNSERAFQKVKEAYNYLDDKDLTDEDVDGWIDGDDTLDDIRGLMDSGTKETRETGLENLVTALEEANTAFDTAVISVRDENDIAGSISNEDILTYYNHEFSDAIKMAVEDMRVILPPSPAVAGVYARVDADRGVWKAPANVSLNRVSGPAVKLTVSENDRLYVHSGTGKSINAIRSFTGKGTLIWGARTIDGGSNEWRYISVRRFFNMVEDSVKSASARFVFEPNDANTWVKVKAMIENFLTTQWRAGALMGSTPDEAFYVSVGLGQTMDENHITAGKMIIEIGMAAVRPAEFIILRFSHKMMES